MQGTPEAPRCGFSRKVVEALRLCGARFGSFDILDDEDVRQGLKVRLQTCTVSAVHSMGCPRVTPMGNPLPNCMTAQQEFRGRRGGPPRRSAGKRA